MNTKVQIEIKGEWINIPENIDVELWLNEPVACLLDFQTLTISRYVYRYEYITGVRKSSKHKKHSICVVR